MQLIRVLFCLSLLMSVAGTAWAGSQPLMIFAASSLRQPFEELADLYRQRTRDERPLLHFSGSQVLRTQLEQGAPADLIASANEEIMAPLVAQGLIEDPKLFAGNRLALLVSGRQEHLHSLSDLATPGLLLAVGNRYVPVGRYTRQFWQNLAGDSDFGPQLVERMKSNIISEESSVKSIVSRIRLGEVDAGFVYRSELTDASRRWGRGIELPLLHIPQAEYPVAIIRQSAARNRAEQFITLLLSVEGQQLLAKYNFLPVRQGDHGGN